MFSILVNTDFLFTSDSAESLMDGKAVNLSWHMTESAGVCARLIEYTTLNGDESGQW